MELLPERRVVVVRFPPRLVLAASAVIMIAASSGAVLLMPGNAGEDTVPVPEIAVASDQQQVPETTLTPGPSITGEQLAAVGLTPARDRAAALIEEQARAEEERARQRERRSDDDGDDQDRWRELRDEIRDACDDGRIRGPICR
ncbi:hypothetical protein GCM10009559_33470 [Pseudonocardia zijingensis]|uniref:Uncharacterized protein n=2 Tax=Pseudonocardia zijingensis TaxID=153376 RepID=A0ABP4ANK8_9PSEU